MLAKCYLCGNEVDEFAIISINPERAVCFDCEDKLICFDCEDKLIQKGKDLKQILFEGGETHGNKR